MARPGADPESVAGRFAFPGRLIRVEPAGSGNVNDTYLAVFRGGAGTTRGIVQRINRRVFKRPAWIIENMRRVTEHVGRRLAREARAENGSRAAKTSWQLPRLVPTKDGRSRYVDGSGEWWRAMTAIPEAAAYARARGPGHAFEAGSVLGRFHRLVADLDPRRLRDTLPGFHVTPRYLKAYDAVRKTPGGRARLSASAKARRLSRFIEERRPLARVLEEAARRGELKPRVIHGDPKCDNIMIHRRSGRGAGIVDLDTVKPGLIHYDFGDAVRSIANPAGEETRRLSGVRLDPGLCAAFVRGYMSQAREFLTAADRGYLYDSIRLLAFELGLRFFSDHLAGDRYFKVRYPGHNLARARVQFKLCEEVEKREAELRRLIERSSA